MYKFNIFQNTQTEEIIIVRTDRHLSIRLITQLLFTDLIAIAIASFTIFWCYVALNPELSGNGVDVMLLIVSIGFGMIMFSNSGYVYSRKLQKEWYLKEISYFESKYKENSIEFIKLFTSVFDINDFERDFTIIVTNYRDYETYGIARDTHYEVYNIRDSGFRPMDYCSIVESHKLDPRLKDYESTIKSAENKMRGHRNITKHHNNKDMRSNRYINSNTVCYREPQSEPQRNTGFESIDIVTAAIILWLL